MMLLAAAVLGIAVFAMNFNIIFRKGKGFPDSEISHSRPLRKEGIICAKEEEMRLWGKNRRNSTASCGEDSCASCHGCPSPEVEPEK